MIGRFALLAARLGLHKGRHGHATVLLKGAVVVFAVPAVAVDVVVVVVVQSGRMIRARSGRGKTHVLLWISIHSMRLQLRLFHRAAAAAAIAALSHQDRRRTAQQLGRCWLVLLLDCLLSASREQLLGLVAAAVLRRRQGCGGHGDAVQCSGGGLASSYCKE